MISITRINQNVKMYREALQKALNSQLSLLDLLDKQKQKSLDRSTNYKRFANERIYSV